MSTVKITKSTFMYAGTTISGEVVIEAAYSEAETRLDIAFIPTVFVTTHASVTSTIVASQGAYGAPIYLNSFAKEAAISTGTVMRASSAKIVTLSFALDVKDLFDSGTSSMFPLDRGYLNVRVELKPEICASAGTSWGQKITPTTTLAASTPVDTTDDLKGTITARGENGSGEGKEKLFDNQRDSKWLDMSPQGSWVQYTYAAGIAGRLTGYTLTSANDAPERDPADWQLQGSNDGGATWTTVDTRTGITFGERFQKLSFTVTGTPTYKAYRLNITKVSNPSSANSVQLAEIELLGQQVSA